MRLPDYAGRDIIGRMRIYDLTLILAPSVDPTDKKKIDTMLTKALTGTNAEVRELTVDGKKTLSYPIRKETSGIYVRVKLAGDSVRSGNIQKQLKLIPEIMRFLLIVREE